MRLSSVALALPHLSGSLWLAQVASQAAVWQSRWTRPEGQSAAGWNDRVVELRKVKRFLAYRLSYCMIEKNIQ